MAKVKTEHQEMVDQLNQFIKSKGGYTFPKTRSLPFQCTLDTRLYLPDVVVLKDGNVTHIIEPESSTGGTTICGKIVLANKAIQLMVVDGKQSREVKPKLIFLYKRSFLGLGRIRYRVEKAGLNTDFLEKIIIDYFPDDLGSLDWFD
jgi:hypothetical protein